MIFNLESYTERRKDKKESRKQLQDCDGPSELWTRKLKTLFHCLDANHNGTLERDDCDSIVERFREYGDLTDDQADRFKSKLKAWWDQSFKESDKVPFEEFMKARYEIMRNSSSQDALQHFKGNLEIMFDAIDTNGDGVISVKEWRVYHLSMNIDNEEMTKDLNHDGKMSLDEFITGAFDFLYNQEDSIYKEFLGPLALL